VRLPDFGDPASRLGGRSRLESYSASESVQSAPFKCYPRRRVVWNQDCFLFYAELFSKLSQEPMGTTKRQNRVFVFVTLFSITALFCSRPASTQTLAETAGATSVSAGTTTAVAKTLNFAGSKNEAAPPASPHLQASAGPPPQVLNRRALEEHAGRDASKLLIRSTPPSSQVWINDKFVGNTPMLLVLAPGKYRVSFRGPRMETGQQSVDLLPRETRDLALSLSAHYPTRVTFR
jgi:hypothetical protein